MRKLVVLLIIIAIIYGGYKMYKWGTMSNTTNDEFTKKQEELQEMIDEQLAKEQEEKIRRLEIQVLQNPEIIGEAMNKVGKLVVFKSGVTYSDVLRYTSFWGAKEVTFDLKYNYGISYDFNNVIVDKFVEKTVYININKFDLQIEYIEQDLDNSKINSDATWFESKFNVEDIESAKYNAKIKVKEFVLGYQEAYVKSMESLKEQLREFILKLGYDDVIFAEMN